MMLTESGTTTANFGFLAVVFFLANAPFERSKTNSEACRKKSARANPNPARPAQLQARNCTNSRLEHKAATLGGTFVDSSVRRGRSGRRHDRKDGPQKLRALPGPPWRIDGATGGRGSSNSSIELGAVGFGFVDRHVKLTIIDQVLGDLGRDISIEKFKMINFGVHGLVGDAFVVRHVAKH